MLKVKSLVCRVAVAATFAFAAPGAMAAPIGLLADSYGYSGNDIAYNLRDVRERAAVRRARRNRV